MRHVGLEADEFGARPERHGEGLLRGRLGYELALIYHDTLQAALPPRLQQIVDRLNEAMTRNGRDEAVTPRPDASRNG